MSTNPIHPHDRAMDRQQDVIRRITAHVVAYRFQLENERHRNMSRLSDKLERARGVVGRVSANIEAKADEVIAREEIIDRRTREAFAGHDEHLDDAMAGLDALERELGQISNAAPSRASGASPAATGAFDRVALGPHPDQPEVADGASQTFPARAAE